MTAKETFYKTVIFGSESAWIKVLFDEKPEKGFDGKDRKYRTLCRG